MELLLAKKNIVSTLGTIYDISSDRVVEFIVVLYLFLQSPVDRALVSIFMLGAILICVTTFLVVGIVSEQKKEKTFHYSLGLIERAEAFIFFILMVMLPQYYQFSAWTFVILVFYTSCYKVIEFKKQV